MAEDDNVKYFMSILLNTKSTIEDLPKLPNIQPKTPTYYRILCYELFVAPETNYLTE